MTERSSIVSLQQNPRPSSPIQVMTDMIPATIALRLGEAAWRATLEAMNQEKKGSKVNDPQHD